MKLKEKLAYEEASGWVNEMAAIHFYIAGFEKAREMFTAKFGDLEAGNSYHLMCGLGEEEVE